MIGRPCGHNEFEQFYRATVGRTLAVACRVAADWHLGRDATQEAYLVMLRRWAVRRDRSIEDNGRYVVGIAVRKVADWYRRTGPVIGLGDDDDHGGEDGAIAEVIDEMSVLQAVRDLIAKQPPRRRAVAVLYFLEERTYPEIAKILSIAESTARTQVERMRVLLKPLIDRMAEIDKEEVGQ